MLTTARKWISKKTQHQLTEMALRPVWRVWPTLTRSWVHQQYRTSGAGVLKPYRNRKVRYYIMGTTVQT